MFNGGCCARLWRETLPIGHNAPLVHCEFSQWMCPSQFVEVLNPWPERRPTAQHDEVQIEADDIKLCRSTWTSREQSKMVLSISSSMSLNASPRLNRGAPPEQLKNT